MRYLLCYVNKDGKLYCDVLNSEDSVKGRIKELFSLQQLKECYGSYNRLFQVIEIEPNYEFLITNIILPKEMEITFK